MHAHEIWWELMMAAVERVPEEVWKKEPGLSIQFALGDERTRHRYLCIDRDGIDAGEGLLSGADAWVAIQDETLRRWIAGDDPVKGDLAVVGDVQCVGRLLSTMHQFSQGKNLVSIRSST